MKAWKGESIKFPALPDSFPTVIPIAFILYGGSGKGDGKQRYTHIQNNKEPW